MSSKPWPNALTLAEWAEQVETTDHVERPDEGLYYEQYERVPFWPAWND